MWFLKAQLSSCFLSSLSQGHSDWVTDVSVSADRKLVASASKVAALSVHRQYDHCHTKLS